MSSNKGKGPKPDSISRQQRAAKRLNVRAERVEKKLVANNEKSIKRKKK